MKNTIIAGAAVALFCGPLFGQQANTPDLAAQNAALEQHVRELEDRLIALEGGSYAAERAASSNSTGNRGTTCSRSGNRPSASAGRARRNISDPGTVASREYRRTLTELRWGILGCQGTQS
jgi:hypothetical protein